MEKTALITGASRGIGAAAAKTLAVAGYRVIVCYQNNAEKAAEISAQIVQAGGIAAVHQVDVSNAASVAALFAAVGNVDILVNNAGIAQQKLFTDITEDEWDTMMDTTAKGAFLCCKAALPYMIRQK